ncbi:MAG: VOC family protein [Halodesulfurarchaeum sp.]
MSDPLLDPDGIDHVECTVPDRDEAADWYREVLGFEIVDRLDHWAEDPTNPLMISPDGGATMLALFAGEPTAPGEGSYSHVAVRTGGKAFLAFLEACGDRPDIEVDGPDQVVDHDQAYSCYFTDPWGHPLEVTTYETAVVADALP